jgi:D-alanyl-D-alanine endopeptidase (penicillin-binding protein 7)
MILRSSTVPHVVEGIPLRKTFFLLLLLISHYGFFIPLAEAKTTSSVSVKAKKHAAKAAHKRKHRAAGLKRKRPGRAMAAKASAGKKSARLRGKKHVRKARRKVVKHVVRPSAGDLAGLNLTENPLALSSNAALVIDESTAEVLYERNAAAVLPIASLTKLMTALVVLESRQDMDEILTVTQDDVDTIKHTTSRLPIGAQLARSEMLHIALMSSENRAASALGRNYPGGLSAFVNAMNAHAALLGMADTHYVEPTGLSSENVSSARDLAHLVWAAQAHPLIKTYSTHTDFAVDVGGPVLQYRNSNRLVRGSDWDIVLQKTGYIAEAGRCLVMQAVVEGRPVIMVFLDAKGKFSRSADANRVRHWLETASFATRTRTASTMQSLAAQ